MLSSLSLLTPPITTRWFLVFWCWGRVGWGRVGGRNNVLYRHLYWLAQQLDATLQDLLMHLHSNLTLRYKIFSCTCTATWRYATRSFLALAQQLDAAPQDLLLHLHSNLTLRYKIFSRTCTAIWRCATRSSLALVQDKLWNTWKKLFDQPHRPQRKRSDLAWSWCSWLIARNWWLKTKVKASRVIMCGVACLRRGKKNVHTR